MTGKPVPSSTKPSLLRTFLNDLAGTGSEPAAADVTLAPEQAAQIRSEQINVLIRGTPAGALGSAVAVMVAVAVLWTQVPRQPLIVWTGAMALVLAVELAFYFRYLIVHAAKRPTQRHMVGFSVAFVCEALIWASSVYFLLPPTFEYQVMLVLIICVVGFATSVYYSVYLPTLYAFNVPLYTALAVAMFLQDSFAHTVVGIAMVVSLGAISAFSRNFNQTLTKAIAANIRTQRLMAEVLVQKEAAEKANLAKTRFLASASHDLRQPMHTISLLVGLLAERIRDTRESDIVDKIQASVHAMGNLFGSLLDISKLDAGAVKPHVREFEIGELLRSIELNYAPQAQEKHLALTVDACTAVVVSDPALLERIVGNLVSNAIRYTHRGEVRVDCERGRGGLTLHVRDTGIGIAEAHMHDIFEEFFQLANPERDRSKGLGLGLSIVKRSVELLGHSLAVTSQPARGSVFSVTVPLASGVPRPAPAVTAAAEPGGSVAGAFIVVIDDEQESRHATETLCRQWTAHVLSAGSAAEAVAKLKDHLRTPDLIISDYRLRDGLNGLMAIEELRRLAETDIPAIIVTGDTAAADIRQMAAAGVDLLHKPVGAMQLRRHAEAALARQTGKGQAVN